MPEIALEIFIQTMFSITDPIGEINSCIVLHIGLFSVSRVYILWHGGEGEGVPSYSDYSCTCGYWCWIKNGTVSNGH